MTSVERGDYDRDNAVLRERVNQMRERLDAADRRAERLDARLEALLTLPVKIENLQKDVLELRKSCEGDFEEVKRQVKELAAQDTERQRYQEGVSLAIDNMKQNRGTAIRGQLIATGSLALGIIGLIIGTVVTILKSVSS